MSDDVPKLPRGRGLRLSRPQMVRIAGTLLLLVFLIVMQRPCADAVSKFVTSFGDGGSAAAQMPRPGNVDVPVAGDGSGSARGSAGPGSDRDDRFEHLRPDMTEDEIKAVIERARLKAARGSAAP
ncbi:MAG TPA: hypothetical protein VGD80_13915 [Kofleriaceae bacterium]